MKIINKLINFAYIVGIVFCLLRLSYLEESHLAKLVELLLAIGTLYKGLMLGFMDNTETSETNNDNVE